MWEIQAYQNSESLFGIFNAIAAMMGAEGYRGSLAAVAVCGFIAALLAYAFAPEKLQGWKWLASVTLVFSLLIVPKVTIGIVDRTGSAPVKVVANIPLGLALFGGVTNAVGSTLTQLFETAFQTIPGPGALPSELTYQKNGLLFGNRLIRETGNLVFQDPGFRTDLVNFLHNCTTYDLIDGSLSASEFFAANDVWALMGNPNPARFTTLTNGRGETSITPCPTAWQNLDARLPAHLERLQDRLAFRLNPTLPAPLAASVIANQVQQAYLKNGLADASATAADIIRQNAMLNALGDSSKLAGQKSNDPAALLLAMGRAQATAQQNASWINSGKIAEQALPVLRNVVEAISYAVFPLFVLLLMMTAGKDTMLAIKAYLAILIWIQLWPPLYAILNYMASIYAAYDLSAAADLGHGAHGLTLRTASTVYGNAISGEAVVGYLVISIPLIAWAAIKRMENFGAALVGGLSGLQATLSGTSGSASSGNVNLGNVTLDQTQLAPNRTSAFMSSWQNDVTGNTTSFNLLSGRSAVSLLRNQGYASRTVSMRVSQQDISEANRQVESAWSESVAANTERSAILAETFSKGLAKLHSSRNSQSTSDSSFEQLGQNLSKLDQISKAVSDRTGLTQVQIAQLAFGANGHIGIGNGLAGAKIHGEGGKSYQAGISSEQQKVLNALTNEQLDAFKQFGDRMSRESSLVSQLSSDASEARDTSSRLSSATTRSQRADAALAERTAYAERLSTAMERGEVMSIDIAQDPHNVSMFMRYAEHYGGNSASALAMFDAELARQSLKPNQTFSDGTALPTSFGDLQRQHDETALDKRLNPDINALRKSHVDRVSGAKYRTPSTSTAQPTSLREQMQKDASHLHDRTQTTMERMDSTAQIDHADDGTISTRKSLLLQAGKQAGQDGETTVNTTKEIIQKALQNHKH